MKIQSISIVKVLSLLTILLTSTASAAYYQDTSDIQQRVIAEAKRQYMDPSLALAIAKVESNFNPQAISHAGARGVMQIMPQTAEQGFGVSRSRLFEPDVNIKLGIKSIKKLLKRYDGHLDIALSHYNGGSGVKNKYGELNVLPATRGYVDKVLATQQDFLAQNYRSLQNRQLLSTSHLNQSGIHYADKNTGGIQTDSQLFDPHSQHPQVETLRALRLHNITRNYPRTYPRNDTHNYKGKTRLPFNGKPVNLKTSVSVQATLSAKMAKVRQWESIYLD